MVSVHCRLCRFFFSFAYLQILWGPLFSVEFQKYRRKANDRNAREPLPQLTGEDDGPLPPLPDIPRNKLNCVWPGGSLEAFNMCSVLFDLVLVGILFQLYS